MLTILIGVLSFPQLKRMLSKAALLELYHAYDSAGELGKMKVLFQYIWEGLQDCAFLTSAQVMPM